jgi:hypothetical protein
VDAVAAADPVDAVVQSCERAGEFEQDLPEPLHACTQRLPDGIPDAEFVPETGRGSQAQRIRGLLSLDQSFFLSSQHLHPRTPLYKEGLRWLRWSARRSFCDGCAWLRWLRFVMA